CASGAYYPLYYAMDYW
nr:immunoglobulin heavy chain junction region [Mus musculus]MBK4185517.1 immunoglobulin heavy chain junction region [Mus musculus]